MKKYAIILLLFSLSYPSCSVKRIDKEKQRTESSAEKAIDSSVTSNEITSINEFLNLQNSEKKNEIIFSSEETNDQSEEIILAAGDSLEIIHFDASGKRTGSKMYKGSGKITNKNTSKKEHHRKDVTSETKTDSIYQKELSKRNATKSRVKIKVSENQKSNSNNLVRETKGFSFWVYLLIFIIVIFLLNKHFKWL